MIRLTLPSVACNRTELSNHNKLKQDKAHTTIKVGINPVMQPTRCLETNLQNVLYDLHKQHICDEACARH